MATEAGNGYRGRQWLATTAEHHGSLRKDFPHMRSLKLFGDGPTGWQNLPSDSPEGYSAQSWKVGEPGAGGNAVVWLEFEGYPEPKALTPEELARIVLAV